MDSMLFFDVSAVLQALEYHHGDVQLFGGNWADIHWMSTPGPIYCGQTDNCGTGPLEAPNHVAVDEKGFQVLYRQPGNLSELQHVVEAADHDPFSGYGADGDLHWSREAIKAWWAEPRRLIEQEVRRLYVAKRHQDIYHTVLKQWLDYLSGDLYQYLQTYAFFLDTRRLPSLNEKLPDL